MLEEDTELAYQLLTDRQEDVPNRLSIGKTWDALHFALTGYQNLYGEGPLANAISAKDGRVIGAPAAFDSPRLLTSDQVAEISKALSEYNVEHLELRYQDGQFRDYPTHGGYGHDPEDLDDMHELLESLQKLRRFYKDAAERRDCVITVVT